MKLAKLGFSIATYLVFLLVFNYLVLFLGAPFLKEWIPVLASIKTINSGPVYFEIASLPIWLSNAALLIAFSVHHSVLARSGIKTLITKLIPASSERSSFVLISCLILAWLFLAWQPQPAIVWQIEGAAASAVAVLFLAGAGLVLWSTFMISHWQLFGLSQAWNEFKGLPESDDEFSTPSLYLYSRHPMYVGILIVIWSTPVMTVGQLILTTLWSVYVMVGIALEEKDLVRKFGARYVDYQNRVPKLLPVTLPTKAGRIAPNPKTQ